MPEVVEDRLVRLLPASVGLRLLPKRLLLDTLPAPSSRHLLLSQSRILPPRLVSVTIGASTTKRHRLRSTAYSNPCIALAKICVILAKTMLFASRRHQALLGAVPQLWVNKLGISLHVIAAT